MKKIIILLTLFLLASCSTIKNGNNIEISETGVKTDDISTSIKGGNIGKDVTITSSGIDISNDGKKNNNKLKNNDEDKDVIVVEDNTGTKDDFNGKTQQEVIDEMSDYVDSLFDMIEEDVK